MIERADTAASADGIILLDKPAGQTSFESLNIVKKRLGTSRVGHAGTLDRFAQGLLLVLAGRMTRLCAFASEMDKEYIARIFFGRGTDTLDPEGAPTAEGRVPGRGELEAVLPRFVGASLQVPPAYSAIHVGGRRASEAARRGETVQLSPRPVRIARLDLLDYAPPEATVRVSCSKGTYIRSLARDIAASLETCAHLSALRRTRVGGFAVESARPPELFDPARDILQPGAFFDANPALGRLVLRPEAVRGALHGKPITAASFDGAPERDGTFGAFGPAGDLVAVVERSGQRWRYAAVLAVGDQSARSAVSEERGEA